MLLTEGEKKESIFKGEGADDEQPKVAPRVTAFGSYTLGSVKRRFADAKGNSSFPLEPILYIYFRLQY